MSVCIIELPWSDPCRIAGAYADEPFSGVLLSDGERARWSYVFRSPEAVVQLNAGDDAAPARVLPDLLGDGAEFILDGPPFQGGVIGLASYEFARRLEKQEANGVNAAGEGWPDLILARYSAVLAFDHHRRRVLAIGRGADEGKARERAEAGRGWMDTRARRCEATDERLIEEDCVATPREKHMAAVVDVIRRIYDGEIFQANIARRWRGRLRSQSSPFDVFVRLAARSPAPYAAYLRLPDRALVSNSPEQLLSIRPGPAGIDVSSQPIKGTRPRGADPLSDAANARALRSSAKDRAENLMIVDLMRNDLARVCRPGSVKVPELFGLRSFANVHHLVSTVTGRLSQDRSAWDAFLAAFPAGSITGAPKLQSMTVIARHETSRGPYCGSLFWADFAGGLEASVLIRTIAFVREQGRWTFEAGAGGGIVADSDPWAEVLETEHKLSAILDALGQTDRGDPGAADVLVSGRARS